MWGLVPVESLIDVAVAERSWITVAGKELVRCVDADHIMLQTECKVFLNPRGVVHKASDRIHKVYHVRIGALCTATKILASKFGDEDVKAESVVIVGNVVDEILSRSTIIVKSESIEGASVAS